MLELTNGIQEVDVLVFENREHMRLSLSFGDHQTPYPIDQRVELGFLVFGVIDAELVASAVELNKRVVEPSADRWRKFFGAFTKLRK